MDLASVAAEATATPTFKYLPLDKENREIRLLIVEPAPKYSSQTVRCTIFHASLGNDPKPRYETISYVWGDASHRATVEANGLLLDVPASAERAVCAMRLESIPRTLWIDALCINQADVHERGHQVALMADIYSNGSLNLVWLGDGIPETATVMDRIRAIVQEVRDDTDDFRTFSARLFTKGGHWTASKSGLRTPVNDILQMVQNLFRNPWFRRLWVVQEVAMAPSNVCVQGEAECALLDILRAALWLKHKRRWIAAGLESKSIDTIRTMWIYVDQPNPLLSRTQTWHLLNDTKNFHASDPRDHIYAVLGLCRRYVSADATQKLPKPDYSRPVTEVFAEATRVMIEEQDLEHLRHVRPRCGDVKNEQWLSWVMRFDRSKERVDPHKLPSRFGTEGKRRYVQSAKENDKATTLSAQGVRLPSICIIRSICPKSLEAPKWLAALHEFETEVATCCHGTADLDEKVAMVLTAGKKYSRQSMDDCEAIAGLQALFSYIKRTAAWPPSMWRINSLKREDFSEDVVQASKNHRVIYRYARHRALFATDDGHIGLGPKMMQTTDIAAILWGCPLPVILRPTKGRDEYRFLGTAYIYGVMDGEAVEEHERSGRRDDTFHLV